MPPTWLTVVAVITVLLALGCALWIVADIYLAGNRQMMGVMEVVWPVTALYAGPLALWFYRRHGRMNAREQMRHPAHGPRVATAIGVSHCGAGCTLGDIVGAFVVFLAGWTLFGSALGAEFALNFTLAFLLGVLFQYFAIAPMRGLGVRDGIVAALKADALSLIAFEVGLFGWMALTQLVFFAGDHLTPDRFAYWLMMQVGMMIGFATSYPVNVWLIRRGIKESM